MNAHRKYYSKPFSNEWPLETQLAWTKYRQRLAMENISSQFKDALDPRIGWNSVANRVKFVIDYVHKYGDETEDFCIY